MIELRDATSADTPAIKALIEAAEPGDRSAQTDVRGVAQWREPDDWADVVVAEENGAMVGYGSLLWPGSPTSRNVHALVHPRWRRRGVGRQLAAWLQARANAAGQTLVGSYHSDIEAAAAFVAALGGRLMGRWHEMVADPLPNFAAPALRDGYTLRHAVRGHDEAHFAEVFRDSFSEHRFMQTPSVESVGRRWSQPQFDGNRIAFAEHAGAIVGVSAIRSAVTYRGDQLVSAGHIGPVGIRAAHRGRGLARALMIDNLNYAVRAGWQTASLAVDEINHHAQALYRSLGFKHVHDWVWWQL